MVHLLHLMQQRYNIIDWSPHFLQVCLIFTQCNFPFQDPIPHYIYLSYLKWASLGSGNFSVLVFDALTTLRSVDLAFPRMPLYRSSRGVFSGWMGSDLTLVVSGMNRGPAPAPTRAAHRTPCPVGNASSCPRGARAPALDPGRQEVTRRRRLHPVSCVPSPRRLLLPGLARLSAMARRGAPTPRTQKPRCASRAALLFRSLGSSRSVDCTGGRLKLGKRLVVLQASSPTGCSPRKLGVPQGTWAEARRKAPHLGSHRHWCLRRVGRVCEYGKGERVVQSRRCSQSSLVS